MSWKVSIQLMIVAITIVFAVEIYRMVYALLLIYQNQIDQINTIFH